MGSGEIETVKALSLWTYIINYSLFGVFYGRVFVALLVWLV